MPGTSALSVFSNVLLGGPRYGSKLSGKPGDREGRSMRALLLAVAIGALLAVGAGLGTGALLAGFANGKPVNAQLYNYGER